MNISEASDFSDSEDEEHEVVLTVESSSKQVNLGTKTKSTVSSWLDSGVSETSNDKDDIQR